ncbi:DUF4097 domain-containing protein [bacterium]|nr:DUF4097 domain-containing protein [bacterium]MBU1072703.1 DUF4097 domain-containing protein [bacterium]MBU1674447.1 DUF4097 domain-containing protein [bacterium]
MSGRTIGLRLAMLAVCLCVATTATAGDRVDETRKVEKDAKISIDNLAGTIEVIGWDKHEVRIQCDLDPKAKKLEITGGEGDLGIKVKYPRKIRGEFKGSELVVQVPHGCRVETESVSADVSVRGVDGKVGIESVSGEIAVRGNPRSLEIASISGLIDVDAETDDVEIESVSGDIFLQNVRKRLSVSSVSGDVEIKAETLDTFSFNVVSGELDLTARPTQQGRWNIDCHSGEVTLYLPADVDAEFEIDSFSGDIDDGFGHEASRTGRYTPGKELSFTQGAGGARIKVSVFSGDVRIVKR